MNTQVSIEVDAKGVLKNKRNAFTNSTTFLAELMQNARRAGANSVAFTLDSEGQLSATDDGRGVESFEKLLRLAQTGWDEQTQQAESPFGEGFFSAIYAAKTISVASRGKKISFDTELALGGRPIDVESDTNAPSKGTKITLSGLDASEEKVASALKRYAMGFPIEVIFNGACLEREHANGGEFEVVQGVGSVRLKRGHLDSQHLIMYLQGLPIGQDEPRHLQSGHIVHLDNALFQARMPDRACLVDHDEQRKKIHAAIAGHIRAHIKNELDSCSEPQVQANRIMDLFEAMRWWGCIDLLNEIPVLPRCMLYDCAIPEMGEDTWEGFYRGPGDPSFVTPEDLAAGRISVVRGLRFIECEGLEDLGDHFKGIGGSPALVMASELGWKKVCGALSDGHWINEAAIDVGELQWVVRLEEVQRGAFNGQFVNTDLVCCKRYAIEAQGLVVHPSTSLGLLDEQCMSPELEGLIVVPRVSTGRSALRMLSSFRDENEHLNEDGRDQEESQLRALVLSMRGDNTSSMRVLLDESRLSYIEGLRGTAHIVHINQHGHIGLCNLEPLMVAAKALTQSELAAMGKVGEELNKLMETTQN